MHDIPQRSRHWVGDGRVIMTSFVDQALARSHQPGHRVRTHSQPGSNLMALVYDMVVQAGKGAPIILGRVPLHDHIGVMEPISDSLQAP